MAARKVKREQPHQTEFGPSATANKYHGARSDEWMMKNWRPSTNAARVRLGSKPAVISALASGLLYLSHPTLAARVSISRSCRYCCKSPQWAGANLPL